MKKNTLGNKYSWGIILIICFFSIFSTTNTFFGEPSSIDLYKNIDTGIYDIEYKMLGFELNGGERKTGIIAEINTLAEYNELPRCLDESKNLSVSKFKKIVVDENIYELVLYFGELCYSAKGEKYSSEMATSYMALFKEYLNKNTTIAEDKTKKIYQVSNIGLYSDGDTENSGFDLISDIEDIDKIIFSKVTEYEGEKNENIDDLIDMLVGYIDDDDGNDNISYIISSNYNNSLKNKISNNKFYPKLNSTNNSNIYNKESVSNYVCSDNEKNSGLNNESLSDLLSNNNLIKNNGTNLINQDSDKPFGKDIIDQNSIGFNIGDPESDYVKITDNSEWPCNNFFCIVIDFITYDGSIFGLENMTIESLIKRSNGHLSKFAGTSLIPAKMSTNQFELGLQNLDLPSTFHLGIEISKKPIPILNIEQERKRDQTEYASKNLLEKYYKANGLDFKRRNSLVMLDDIEQDKQNINNSVGLSIDKIAYNNRDYYKYKSEHNNSSILNKIIEKKVGYGVTQNFEEQFIELDKFISGINDYIENLFIIISEMEKIPIDSA